MCNRFKAFAHTFVVCVLSCAPAEAAERAELQQRRQQQASQIFKVQQKQYENAYLAQLDDYIVGGVARGKWRARKSTPNIFNTQTCPAVGELNFLQSVDNQKFFSERAIVVQHICFPSNKV